MVLMIEDEDAKNIVMKGEESNRLVENVRTRRSVVYCKGHDKSFRNQGSAIVCFALVVFLLYSHFNFTAYPYYVLVK